MHWKSHPICCLRSVLRRTSRERHPWRQQPPRDSAPAHRLPPGRAIRSARHWACGALAPGPVLITLGTGGQVFAATSSPLIDQGGKGPHITPPRTHCVARSGGDSRSRSCSRLDAIHAGADLPISRAIVIPSPNFRAGGSWRTHPIDGHRGARLVPSPRPLASRNRPPVCGARRDRVRAAFLPRCTYRTSHPDRASDGQQQAVSVPIATWSRSSPPVLQRPLELQAQREGSGRGAALLGAAAAGRTLQEFESPATSEVVNPPSDRMQWHAARYEPFPASICAGHGPSHCQAPSNYWVQQTGGATWPTPSNADPNLRMSIDAPVHCTTATRDKVRHLALYRGLHCVRKVDSHPVYGGIHMIARRVLAAFLALCACLVPGSAFRVGPPPCLPPRLPVPPLFPAFMATHGSWFRQTTALAFGCITALHQLAQVKTCSPRP